jgi:hypothetical protein
MGDPRIAAKSFNPYDLGAVARASREFQERGYHGRYSEPYVPPQPRQNETQPLGSNKPEKAGSAKS